jgi:hypothetical protein
MLQYVLKLQQMLEQQKTTYQSPKLQLLQALRA